MLTKFLKWIERLFNKHMLVRRFMVFWAMGLITWVVLTVFTDLPSITGHVVTATSLVIGLLATVLAFYKWQRAQDNVEQNNDCDVDSG